MKEISMRVVIPSRGRPDRQITARALRTAGIPFTIVRTIGDSSAYPEEYPQVWCESVGIMDKRNWILDNFGPKMFVVDDDISFMRVLEGKTFPAGPDDLARLFALVCSYLDQYAHVGVSQRFMIQHKPQPFEKNRRIMGVRGYNLDLFPTPAPRFRLQACSDIDFTMQLMSLGRSSLVVTEYAQQDGPYMAPGGCSTWRTDNIILEGHQQLAKLWPSYVKLRVGADKPGGVLATIYLAKLAKDHGLEI